LGSAPERGREREVDFEQLVLVLLLPQMWILTKVMLQVEDTLNSSNDLFLTFRKEMEDMSKKTKRLEKENLALTRKCEMTARTLHEVSQDRGNRLREVEILRKKNENLEKLCRSLHAQARRTGAGLPPPPPPPLSDDTESEHGEHEGEVSGDAGGMARSHGQGHMAQFGPFDDEETDEEQDPSRPPNNPGSRGGVSDVSSRPAAPGNRAPPAPSKASSGSSKPSTFAGVGAGTGATTAPGPSTGGSRAPGGGGSGSSSSAGAGTFGGPHVNGKLKRAASGGAAATTATATATTTTQAPAAGTNTAPSGSGTPTTRLANGKH